MAELGVYCGIFQLLVSEHVRPMACDGAGVAIVALLL